MRPVDINAMIELVKMPDAPVMLCQAGYVFVNTHHLSHHPQIQNQLNKRLENNILNEVSECRTEGVVVYCMTAAPQHPVQIKKQEKGELFTLNFKPKET